MKFRFSKFNISQHFGSNRENWSKIYSMKSKLVKNREHFGSMSSYHHSNEPYRFVSFNADQLNDGEWINVNECSFVQPPIVPKVNYDGDTCNFDEYPEADWQRTPTVAEKDYKLFDSF